MKITGPGGPKSVEKSDNKKKSSGAGKADFGAMMTSLAAEAEALGAAKKIAQVDALIAAQSVEDPMEKAAQKRMKKRSYDILNALDGIRMALINGNLRVSHIENISRMVAVNREKIQDPGLSALLDEIDLRAHVEMAKLEAAKAQQLKQMGYS